MGKASTPTETPKPTQADAVLDRLASEFTSTAGRLPFSKLLTNLFAASTAVPSISTTVAQPNDPLPAGKVGPEVTVDKATFGRLMNAAANQSNKGVEIWTSGDSELIVATGKVTVELSDGLVIVDVPVWSDQSGAATIQVPFAVGGANTPAGMLVATEQHPRGPDAIIVVWSDALLAFAWKTLLTVATRVAASAGKDVDGAGLIPASLTATADGVRILTMARHMFDRVSG